MCCNWCLHILAGTTLETRKDIGVLARGLCPVVLCSEWHMTFVVLEKVKPLGATWYDCFDM